MQLDELVFAVDSTQLEKANKLMQELGISIQALDKKDSRFCKEASSSRIFTS